jgi:IclR family KDG regulon transcriptional repressor
LLGMNKASVYRILSDLNRRGYITQREKGGKYFLGSVYLKFSSIVKNKVQLREIINKYLLELSRQINESVAIAYANGIENISHESF